MKPRLFVLCLSAVLACLPVANAETGPLDPAGFRQILFLGDSITQGGGYVFDFDTWLVSRGIDTQVINLGLGSETASDLTEEENAGHKKAHGFGRPVLGERLGRIFEALQPDLVVACYGMNDGSSLPATDEGLQRFREAITRLRETALKAGAKEVVLLTPPPQDAGPGKPQSPHDLALGRFREWLVGQRAAGWRVVDIHGPMSAALAARREKEPGFRFSPDGVHPNDEGHLLMAKEIIRQAFGTDVSKVTKPGEFFASAETGQAIHALVVERDRAWGLSWLSKIGHTRPGIAAGKPLEEASKEAAARTEKIRALRSPAAAK